MRYYTFLILLISFILIFSNCDLSDGTKSIQTNDPQHNSEIINQLTYKGFDGIKGGHIIKAITVNDNIYMTTKLGYAGVTSGGGDFTNEAGFGSDPFFQRIVKTNNLGSIESDKHPGFFLNNISLNMRKRNFGIVQNINDEDIFLFAVGINEFREGKIAVYDADLNNFLIHSTPSNYEINDIEFFSETEEEIIMYIGGRANNGINSYESLLGRLVFNKNTNEIEVEYSFPSPPQSNDISIQGLSQLEHFIIDIEIFLDQIYIVEQIMNIKTDGTAQPALFHIGRLDAFNQNYDFSEYIYYAEENINTGIEELLDIFTTSNSLTVNEYGICFITNVKDLSLNNMETDCAGIPYFSPVVHFYEYNGTKIWEKVFNFSEYSDILTASLFDSGSLLFSGITSQLYDCNGNSCNAGNGIFIWTDIWGNVVNSKTVGNSSFSSGFNTLTPFGDNVMLGGWTESCQGEGNAWLVEMDQF